MMLDLFCRASVSWILLDVKKQGGKDIQKRYHETMATTYMEKYGNTWKKRENL